MVKQPKVSVIVTNYNYANYIRESLDSVANQTHTNLELIIINDGSTDNSDEVIKSWLHDNRSIAKKTNYISQENQGISFARNTGLGAANGEYLIFLDADDYFPNDYIEKLASVASSSGADVVYGNTCAFTETGEIDKTDYPDFALEIMMASNIINISTLIKTNVARTNEFDMYLNRRSHEDWDFFLGLALSGAYIVHTKDTELFYRVKIDSRNVAGGAGQYQKVYDYITKKYSQKYPKLFDDISHNWEHKREKWIQNAQINIGDLQNELARKDLEIADITNSTTYKVLSNIAAPARKMKRILRGKK